jgi:hypothetical protein
LAGLGSVAEPPLLAMTKPPPPAGRPPVGTFFCFLPALGSPGKLCFSSRRRKSPCPGGAWCGRRVRSCGRAVVGWWGGRGGAVMGAGCAWSVRWMGGAQDAGRGCSCQHAHAFKHPHTHTRAHARRMRHHTSAQN